MKKLFEKGINTLKKSAITDYTDYCILCGTPTTDMHHCIFGVGNRKLCDEDKILIPVCRCCHDEIHGIGIAGKLSKMLGQAIYERNALASGEVKTIDEAREKFRRRYGNCYY